ncbi:hypothetical protein Syun_015669 [Stephania yunnanensis]|uniref:Uncharacterized protein n=1 Tax=Stephania yunnanensis TaxID=152371 RepID=A0AAP0JM55_9MAGN
MIEEQRLFLLLLYKFLSSLQFKVLGCLLKKDLKLKVSSEASSDESVCSFSQ